MFACLPYSLGWLTVFISSSVYHLYLSRLLVGVSHALLTTTGNFNCGVLSSKMFYLELSIKMCGNFLKTRNWLEPLKNRELRKKFFRSYLFGNMGPLKVLT